MDKTSFLDGGGTMGAAARGFDWAGTPLGPAEDWPQSLKTAASLVLASHFPMCLVWGPGLITIYNDAFIAILGAKPFSLGKAFDAIWHEAWDALAPIAAKALAGEATYIADYPLTVERRGQPEQAYFTFCYSPVRDETGEVAGFLDTVIETTAAVETAQTSKLLNAELAHRIKNTLAMVSGIAAQTLRGVEARDKVKAFEQRIMALARAHDILVRQRFSRRLRPAEVGDL